MSKIDNEAFNTWYDRSFGTVLGGLDEENRTAIMTVWNAVVDHVASRFEYELFEEMTGTQVSEKIRRMKAK